MTKAQVISIHGWIHAPVMALESISTSSVDRTTEGAPGEIACEHLKEPWRLNRRWPNGYRRMVDLAKNSSIPVQVSSLSYEMEKC